MIDRLSDRPVGARTVKAKGHRVDMRVKDFIATRLSGAATRLAKRAMEIEEANPYPGYERAHSDSAEVLGVPVGTVRSRLYYAMRGLRAALDADAQPDV